MKEHDNVKTNIYKGKDITVRIKSNFTSDSNLADILYSIANTKLKQQAGQI